MSQRWTLLLLGLLAPSFSFASQSFENTAIVRTVELGGSLVHVTTTYAVKALEAGSSVYTIALEQQQKERTSWAEAKIKGQSNALELQDLGYDEERCASSIHCPHYGRLICIVITATHISTTYTFPKHWAPMPRSTSSSRP